MIRSFFPISAGLLVASALTSAAEPTLPPNTTLGPAPDAKSAVLQVPAAIAVDDQGRVLVAENPPGAASPAGAAGLEWFLDDLAASQPAQRLALLEKWQGKIPAEFLAHGVPQVRRFSDPAGDGSFSEVATFPGAPAKPPAGASAALLAHDGATFFGCIPGIQLLAEPADHGAATPKPLVTGLGIRQACAAHGLRGFTMGPDGRFYGTMGDFGLNVTTAAGVNHPLPNQGCAFRMEPDGTGFEIVHAGLRNPCGVAFDAAGNAFTLDTAAGHGDAARLVYLVDGGDSGWQMEQQAMLDFYQRLGLTQVPPVEWLEEHVWQDAESLQPAFIVPPVAHFSNRPVGLASHPGTGFLESEAGRFLVCDNDPDPAKAGLWSFAVTADGAGMKLTDSRQLVGGLTAAAVAYSWDGKLIIADAGTNRLRTLSVGEHIWRAAEAADAAKIARENLDERESADLLPLLKHPDFRIRLRAQFALTRKPDALARFATAIASTDATARLHAIWGVGILARRGCGVPHPVASFGDLPDQQIRLNASQQLVALLKHQDAEVRAQAVRALGECLNRFIKPPDPSQRHAQPEPGSYIKAEELPLAAMLSDAAPRVRFFAALTIGKLKVTGFYGPICDFIQANNNQDPYLRHAGSFALEHLITTPLMLTGLERHPSAAVRMAATVALRRLNSPDAATFINDPDPLVADEAIRAVTDLSLDEVRPSLAFLLDELAVREWRPFMLRRLVHNAFRMGTAANAARLVKLLGNPAIPAPVQQEILRLLPLWVEPPPVDQLTGHWRPLAKRDPAEIKPALIAELPRLFKLDGFIRTAAIELNTCYQLKLPVPAVEPTR